MKFIHAVQEATTAKINVFGGAVVFEIKILSPMEAEAAGLASSLVASSVLDHNQMKKLARKKEILENVDVENPNEEDLDQLFNLLHGFDVGQMMKIEEHQNKILKQVVWRASEDHGENFEQIYLVDTQEQQDPDQNLLWIGAIPKEDRAKILEVALKSHKEVTDHLQTFRRQG